MAAAAQQGRKMMMKKDDDDGQKSSWPELVGARAEYAADVIKKDRPDVDDIEVIVGTVGPPDYNDHRVVLFVHQDFNLKVARTPVIG